MPRYRWYFWDTWITRIPPLRKHRCQFQKIRYFLKLAFGLWSFRSGAFLLKNTISTFFSSKHARWPKSVLLMRSSLAGAYFPKKRCFGTGAYSAIVKSACIRWLGEWPRSHVRSSSGPVSAPPRSRGARGSWPPCLRDDLVLRNYWTPGRRHSGNVIPHIPPLKTDTFVHQIHPMSYAPISNFKKMGASVQ